MNSGKKESKNQTATKRIGKFTIIGIILTLFNFIIYTLLARLVIKNNDYLWIATMIAYVLATILAFFLHSNITWKEHRPSKTGIINFFIWNLITAITISPFLTWLFKFFTPLYQLFFNISSALNFPFDYDFVESTSIFVLAAIITMILNYLFYDKLVFGTSKKDKHEQ